MVLKIMF